MKIQPFVSTLAFAGVIVFCAWCLTAARFPEGGGIRIQGPGGITIDAQLGGGNHQEALPSKDPGAVRKTN